MINTHKQFKNSIFKDGKYNYLKVHEYNTHEVYEFSFSPEYQATEYVPSLQKIKMVEYAQNKICPLVGGHQKHYMDVSTKSQNIHFHGTVCFSKYNEIVKFYDNIKKLKEYCTFSIMPIHSWTYLSYMRKTIHLYGQFTFRYDSRIPVKKSPLDDGALTMTFDKWGNPKYRLIVDEN